MNGATSRCCSSGSPAALRDRRLAAVSENVGHDDEPWPEQTSDDTDEGWTERADEADDDERILRERPPHW